MFTEWLEASRGYLSGWKLRSARCRGIRVFHYHGVVERKGDPLLDRNQMALPVFRAQMAYLRRFRVLSVSELIAELEFPGTGEGAAAMVTFDDGFFNNLMAAEVLSRCRIPWTLFVPSGEVGPRRAQWSVEVSLLLMCGRAEKVEALGRTCPLRSRPERERIFREMQARLKAVPSALRVEAVAALRAQFPEGESDRLLGEHPELRMLTWEELSQLSKAGVEIGSHGRQHEIHHADQPERVRVAELVDSRSELEERLGRPCRAFAYPNGDFVADSPLEVERAGYELAFTTKKETLAGKTRNDRFLLPRLSSSDSLSGFVRRFWWEDERTAPHTEPAASSPSAGGVADPS